MFLESLAPTPWWINAPNNKKADWKTAITKIPKQYLQPHNIMKNFKTQPFLITIEIATKLPTHYTGTTTTTTPLPSKANATPSQTNHHHNKTPQTKTNTTSHSSQTLLWGEGLEDGWWI